MCDAWAMLVWRSNWLQVAGVLCYCSVTLQATELLSSHWVGTMVAGAFTQDQVAAFYF
jgi:hypothetical protein